MPLSNPPQAWELSGDAYSTHKGDRPWISEMYGYSYGCSTADVWHLVHHTAMLYPGYEVSGGWVGGPVIGPARGAGRAGALGVGGLLSWWLGGWCGSTCRLQLGFLTSCH